MPLSQDVPAYRPHTARRDLVAGLTVAALAVPAAMAYAELAGLSPVHGLYALLLPAVLYAVLGSSKPLIIGPEGSISALVAAAILPFAVAGSSDGAELAAMLALLVAGCFVAAWLLRLGWIADYLSRPVLIGYKGYVYDVTGRFMWMAGRHFWLRAGHDLTGRMTDSPHGEEILDRVADENSQPDFLRGTFRLHGLTVDWRWPA